MDWGCSSLELANDSAAPSELHTIHLSPYQGAPFDLHVGFGLNVSDNFSPTSALPGFYFRKRQKIEAFLTKLSSTSRQGLCDAVFDAIASRLTYAVENRRKDPTLDRDVKNLRTLSTIAAGCGGQQLASIFRCLLYNYRHYSGGLPDLLLVRATHEKDGSRELVGLSDWVGESLSVEYQQEQEAIRGALMIADDEFLGCSKVGDSGTISCNRSNGGRSPRMSKMDSSPKDLSLGDLPQKLLLFHKDLVAEPECMMVEVKSSIGCKAGRLVKRSRSAWKCQGVQV